MIEKVLDEYELKARVAPGLIVALPVLVDSVYAAPILSSWPILVASGMCSLALVYGLGHDDYQTLSVRHFDPVSVAALTP